MHEGFSCLPTRFFIVYFRVPPFVVCVVRAGLGHIDADRCEMWGRTWNTSFGMFVVWRDCCDRGPAQYRKKIAQIITNSWLVTRTWGQRIWNFAYRTSNVELVILDTGLVTTYMAQWTRNPRYRTCDIGLKSRDYNMGLPIGLLFWVLVRVLASNLSCDNCCTINVILWGSESGRSKL